MCGIVGAIAQRDIVPILVEGLKRLEYRGYDSAGAAVLHDGKLERVRRVGRVAEMEAGVAAQGLAGPIGIGHTRWATHGGVTESNAHPHISRDEIAVVHNGIIENHEEQRLRLSALGYVFESQTDTEVIAHPSITTTVRTTTCSEPPARPWPNCAAPTPSASSPWLRPTWSAAPAWAARS